MNINITIHGTTATVVLNKIPKYQKRKILNCPVGDCITHIEDDDYIVVGSVNNLQNLFMLLWDLM